MQSYTVKISGKKLYKFQSSIDEIPTDSIDLSTSQTLQLTESRESLNDYPDMHDKENETDTNKSMDERGATEQGKDTERQKEVDSNQEARIRAKSFGGSGRETPCYKSNRYNSEQRSGNDGLRVKQVSMGGMPSPVQENSPVLRVKEAFVYETNASSEERKASENMKDQTDFGKPSAREMPYAGSGKKISKFYSKPRKDTKK